MSKSVPRATGRRPDPPAGVRLRPLLLRLAPGQVIGPMLLAVIASLWFNDLKRAAPMPAQAPLPPRARQRIRTSGAIIASLAFRPDGRGLIWGDSMHGGIGAWDSDLGRTLRYEPSRRGPSKINRLGVAPDGRTIAAADLFGGVMVWDSGLDDGPLPLAPRSWIAHALAFTRDGSMLVAGGKDGKVRAWDTASWRELMAWTAQDEPISCFDLAPDCKSLVVGSYRGGLRRWAIDGSRLLAGWRAHDWAVVAIEHSPDGRVLTSAGIEGRVRHWDARTGHGGSDLPMGGRNLVHSLAYSPDGSVLATGDARSSIDLWDAATDRHLERLEGHHGLVRSLAFSPDGRTLASGASDSSILLWDIAATYRSTARPTHGPAGAAPAESPVPFGRQPALTPAASSHSAGQHPVSSDTRLSGPAPRENAAVASFLRLI